MFCTKCGKQLDDNWKNCPYCGTETSAKDEKENIEKSFSESNEYGNSNNYQADYPLQTNINEMIQGDSFGYHASSYENSKKINKRSFGKYFFLSLITCGIYGIYELYGFAKDVNDICEGDGKKSQNYIKVLLLGLVTCGIYIIYWWYKQANRIQEAGDKYGVQVRENGTTILIWEILGVTVMPGIGGMVATYIMFDNVNRITLGYNGEKTPEELQQMSKPHPHLVRNVIITYAVIVVLLIALIGSAFAWLLKSMSDDENYYDDFDESEVVQEEIKDFSDLDMEILVGASVEEVEKAGFNIDDDGMSAGNENVILSFDENQRVNLIGIGGEADIAPSFHGVTLGMEKYEAIEKLTDAYPILEEEENDLFMSNLNTRGTVYCQMEEGKVVAIGYSVLTDDDLAEISENEYIFPDSDKKYLSEDEVRSVEVDKLRIGRNEIFARYGVIFKSEDLQKYFSGCSWYEGTVSVDSFNAEATFNDFEKKNVELIKRIEDEVNGTGSAGGIDTSLIQDYCNDVGYYGEMSNVYIYFGAINGNQIEITIADEMAIINWCTGTIIDSNTVEFISEGCVQTIHFNRNYSFTITGNPGAIDFRGDYFINAG